ncbi:hypothetical protein R6Q59_022393 [Mikania micrantha]
MISGFINIAAAIPSVTAHRSSPNQIGVNPIACRIVFSARGRRPLSSYGHRPLSIYRRRSLNYSCLHGLWDLIIGRFCNLIVVQFNPNETNNAHESEVVVHLNGGIRLPITVQGASRRVLSLSSSDMKATRQQEDDGTPQSEQLSSVAGGIVALGKFDALHIGHRELAIQAAKAGTPFLLSFTGMAEVLGWEPRAPVVAKCDRERVLSSWSAWCGEVTPTELEVEFSKVRNLTPRQFVEKLSKELGVRGVVAGKNYRFGYRAAGDASELSRLCEEYGIEAYIINPVMDQKQSILNREFTDSKERGQVSSTRVRYALSEGDMNYVSELLGRHHRLILMLNDDRSFISNKNMNVFPRSYLLNLPPKEGVYKNCSIVFGKESVVPCRVVVDADNIRLELVEIDCIYIHSGDSRYLNIEFGA